MKEPVINDFVKSYLIACLISGIHVEADPHLFMTGLVDHMNSLKDRIFWATGDEDGVILHDKFDIPILSLIYKNNILKFMIFEQEDSYEQGVNKDAGLMLLNIIGYMRDEGFDCEPVALKSASTVVPPPYHTTGQDDWSL